MLSYRFVYIQYCGTRQPLAGNRQTFRVGRHRPINNRNNSNNNCPTPPRTTIQKSPSLETGEFLFSMMVSLAVTALTILLEREREKERTAALTWLDAAAGRLNRRRVSAFLQ
jgi:hypothetical protein